MLEWQIAGLILLAALLHASWNAVTKASSDPLLGIAIVTASGGALSALALPFVPFPEAAAWPFLAGSVLLHLLYQAALVRAYSLGDLSQVYPVARGMAPLGVALLAALSAGEIPAPRQALGLLLACAAIASLGLAGRSARSSDAALRSAALTALLISSYTVVDGHGVRSVANPLSYIAWMMFLDSFPILALALVVRRGAVGSFVRAEGARAAGGGAMAVVGYGIVLFALSRGAMAPVAALRETSVLFAAWIGARLLREPLGGVRIAASAVLAAGLALMHA